MNLEGVRYLSRMIACDICGEGVYDKDMTEMYHVENGRDVIDAIIHETCIPAYRA